MRRAVEIAIVLLLLPVTLLLSVFISLAIWFDDKGRIFFVQQRPGKGNIAFRMVKFRTMYENSTQLVLASENDVRITRTGKWLRKYRLDEIPQLWNVMRGDMSLIGPRPVPQNFFRLYCEEIPSYELRHQIRPGITGYAQVMQGYTRTIDEERLKFEYDLFYINNISLRLDLRILKMTVKNVLIGKL